MPEETEGRHAMTDRSLDPAGQSANTTTGRPRPKYIIAMAVVALFIGTVAGKLMADGASPTATSTPSTATTTGATITSARNDAVADYEAAIRTGKPIYVLFHSLTCEPCIEISKVVDQVMPEYDGRIVFVNAITDDPSAQRLAARFQFQYIPTSFFLTPDGTVLDSFTGAMNAEQLRTYLDKLETAR